MPKEHRRHPTLLNTGILQGLLLGSSVILPMLFLSFIIIIPKNTRLKVDCVLNSMCTRVISLKMTVTKAYMGKRSDDSMINKEQHA